MANKLSELVAKKYKMAKGVEPRRYVLKGKEYDLRTATLAQAEQLIADGFEWLLPLPKETKEKTE